MYMYVCICTYFNAVPLYRSVVPIYVDQWMLPCPALSPSIVSDESLGIARRKDDPIVPLWTRRRVRW